MKTIRFKSIQFHWKKEYLGLKNNTIRKQTEKDDVRFEVLNEFINSKFNELFIEIENCETKEIFRRQVTDVTYFEGYYVITWKCMRGV